MLDGIIRGSDQAVKAIGSFAGLWEAYVHSFEQTFNDQLDSKGAVNWYGLLKHING